MNADVARLAIALLAVLSTWALFGVALAGIGLGARRLLGRRTVHGDGLFDAFWIGYASLLGALQVWHLFAPIDALALVTVFVLGAAGIAASGRGLARWLARWPRRAPGRRSGMAVALVGLVLVVWLADQAIGPAVLHDTKMYQTNVVRWANAYPAVRGLANLQSNLGHSAASHLFSALVDNGPWDGRSHHFANGLLLTALALRGVAGAARIARARNQAPGPVAWTDAYFALSPAIVVALALRGEASSLSSDLPAGLLAIVAGGLLIRFIARPAGRRDRPDEVVGLLAILAAAVCVKLSTLVFASVAGLVVLAVAIVRRRRRSGGPSRERALPLALPVVLLAVGFLGPWMARSVVLNGYPLYPLAIAPAAVDWRYPEPRLPQLRRWIRSHGRGYPSAVRDAGLWDTSWIPRWVDRARRGERDRLVLPLAMAATGAIVLVVSRRSRRARPVPDPYGLHAAAVLLPAAAGSAFWLLGSPAVRFGFGFLWVGGAGLLALAIAAGAPGSTRARRRLLAAALVAVPLAVPLHAARGRDDPFLRPAGDDALGFHRTESGAARRYVTRSGLNLWVPLPPGNSCWNIPLPCTHKPNPHIRLRRPGSPADGFATDPARPQE